MDFLLLKVGLVLCGRGELWEGDRAQGGSLDCPPCWVSSLRDCSLCDLFSFPPPPFLSFHSCQPPAPLHRETFPLLCEVRPSGLGVGTAYPGTEFTCWK